MWKRVLIVIAVVVFLLMLVVAGGFAYLYFNGMSGMSANTEAKEGQIKVACVGDSITYGHGVSNWPENNYPIVLQKLLGEGYHVANFGSSGACVNPDGDQPYVSRAIYQESLDYQADILIFMLGANDTKPENWKDAENFIEEYKELLGTYLVAEKKPKVYIGLSTKAYYINGVTSGLAEYDIQPALVEEMVAAVQEWALSKEIEVEVIDVYSLTVEHPEWFESDGVHPNKDGAKAIAELVAEAIK